MRTPALKEHLLDGEDPEGDELDLRKEIERLKLDYPEEAPGVRAIRLANQHRIDSVVIAAYGIVVAISVLSCAIAMWFSASEVLTVLFTISILQGPLVMYQRLQILKANSTREAIAELWQETVSLKNENYRVEDKIATMEKDSERLRAKLTRYKPMVKGYGLSDITDLFHENERILFQKKQLAEAIGVIKLTTAVLGTDVDRDHFVGEAELSLLGQRIESIEGVPLTSEEVCERFRREEMQTLGTLSDLVVALYIEKRRLQHATKSLLEENSPRNFLGAPLLWKKPWEMSSSIIAG